MANADDRPIRYVEGDKVVYRASGLGACERLIVATAQADAYPPAPMPDWFREVLAEGTHAEPLISLIWDTKTEVPTIHQQMVVELEVMDNVIVRGHIDGQAGVGPVGREFKKFRESTWQRFLTQGVECYPMYPWQVAAMMHATGWEWEFVGGRWEGDRITEVHGFPITEPPIPFRAIHKKVRAIEEKIAAGFDAKEVPCNLSMYPCAQWKIHDVPDDEGVFEIPVSGSRAEETREYLRQIFQANEEIRALDKQVTAWDVIKHKAADGLRECLGDFGAEAINAKKLADQVDGWRVQHVSKVIPAHTRREVTQDYFVVKQEKPKDGEQGTLL